MASTKSSENQLVAFAACTAAGVPVLFKGHPGQGKSARFEQILQRWNRHTEIIVSSSREATDYLGIPVEIDGEIRYIPFGWTNRLNKAPQATLILDEFNLGADSAMRAQLRVIQERYVGDTKLGPNVSITAIMNPPESSAGGMDLMAPVSNRFIHLDYDFDEKLWSEGLLFGFDTLPVPPLSSLISTDQKNELARLATLVTQFHTITGGINLTPEPPIDPIKAGQPWASPRSWHNAILAMSYIPSSNTAARKLVLAGAVGPALAAEFLTHIKNAALPSPADVIADPTIVNWNDRADILFAITRAVAAHVRFNVKNDESIWIKGAEALAVCSENGKPDIAQAALQSMIASRPRKTTLTSRVIDAFRDILQHLPNGVVQEAPAAPVRTPVAVQQVAPMAEPVLV